LPEDASQLASGLSNPKMSCILTEKLSNLIRDFFSELRCQPNPYLVSDVKKFIEVWDWSSIQTSWEYFPEWVRQFLTEFKSVMDPLDASAKEFMKLHFKQKLG
jgi:hypothetical protein